MKLAPCVLHHQLEDAFDTLVETETGYAALDDWIIKTADKRA